MFSDDVEEIVKHVTQSDHGENVFLILSNGAFGGLFARLKEELGEGLAVSEPSGVESHKGRIGDLKP